jgi:hypothetical protein
MKIHVLVVLVFALIFNSCKKKSLPPAEDEPAPIFYFKCDIGGLPVNIDAGVNSYYMKSSYYQDSNSVYVFSGELKQKDCSSNCGFGLTVLINDYKQSPNGTMYIDSTLSLTSYQFNDGNIEPLYYTGYLSPRPLAQNVSYNWSFSDGSISNITNCTKIFKANTTYSCTLATNSSTFGNINHTNVFEIGNPVQTSVSAVRVSPFTVYGYKFTPSNTTGLAPFTYFWDFGDGFTYTQPAPTHEYLVSNYYTAKLTVVDANMDSCVSYYQVPALDGLFGEANYSASFLPIQNTKAFSAVTILVNDPQGKVYSSKLVNQDPKNNFEVVSIENYKAADSNQLFKKIKIRFNCTVINGTNSIEIKGGEAVIAIAYKN